MIFQWFFSRTVRQATEMRRHVRKLVHSQRDLLSPEAENAVLAAEMRVGEAIRAGKPKSELLAEMKNLEQVANGKLRPYPNAALRENFEVLLVAIAVAMGVRTFFLQPFKIPTGSMQPTLFGVVSQPLAPEAVVPTGIERVKEWFQGVSYLTVKAKASGEITEIDEKPFKILLFNIHQSFVLGGVKHHLWFPPDFGSQTLSSRGGIHVGDHFEKGQDVLKFKVQAGDHLFVNRLTYNFRHPRRGEIVVFETKGIDNIPEVQFYIKRLIAMGDESVRIDDDHHVVINGRKLTAADPGFENVYTFDPRKHEENGYFGHVNERTGRQFGMPGLAPWFPDARTEFPVPPGHFLVMGDNTMNSSDSRTWGAFNRTNVIGSAAFVYWPLTRRFGWGFR